MEKGLKWLIILVINASILAACKQQNSIPNKLDLLGKIKQSADLATVEYVVTKVITSKKGSTFIGFKLGDDATFMAKTKATIKAGIDLNEIRAEDINIQEKDIDILLPPVKLINFSYPAESFETIEEYSSQSFWNQITISEKDELFRQGEIDIRKTIDKLGIHKTAERNTRILLESFLKSLGFNNVTISFKQ